MKHIIFILLLSIAFASCNNSKDDLAKAKKLYNLAVSNEDVPAARMALLQILCLDSTNVQYQDSIARLYIKGGNFKTGIKYAEEVYNRGKASIKLKESMAIAYQQNGDGEKSESFFASLLSETNDYKYKYQQLVIHFENGNQPMFDSLSRSIITEATQDSVIAATKIDMPGPVSGIGQKVPIVAATYFLVGNNALEKRQDVNTAIKNLQESLRVYPDLEYSKYILMEIEKLMMGNRRR